MNADLEELIARDAALRDVVVRLRAAPQRAVAAGFGARVQAEVRAARRRARVWLAAAGAAAVLAVALAAGPFVSPRPAPCAAYAAWIQWPRTVRLAPYNSADWYEPLVAAPAPAQTLIAPFCTREALVACMRP